MTPRDALASEVEPEIESRRSRPVTELRLPAPPPWGKDGELSDELRSALWDVVHRFLFEPSAADGAWKEGASLAERPVIRRVWSAPPLSADLTRIPDDVADVVDGWFSLVEAPDAYALLESVMLNLEPSRQEAFASACNTALERARSEQRFVNRRLVPVPSRSDVTAIERALGLCRALGPIAVEMEEHLIDAIDRLGNKPQPDRRGAAQEAIRAVEAAAFTLTGERHMSLDDALHDLEQKGFLDGPMKVAFGGLFAYASGHRIASSDDARIIVVMCACFISHLAAKMR